MKLLDGNPINRHLYKAGDRVKILNSNMRGETIVEGLATVRSLTEIDHTYMVEFDSEPGETYERLAGPGQQI